MRFASQLLEKAWQEELARSKRTHDIISMVISIMLLATAPPELWRTLRTAAVVAFTASSTVSGLAIIYMARQSSPWYHKHRCKILFTRQLLVVVLYFLIVGCGPLFDILYPIDPEARTRMLLVLPAMTLNIMMSNVLPLHLKAPIAVAISVLSATMAWKRCATEAALFPLQFAWYKSVFGDIDGVLRRYVPLQVDIIHNKGPMICDAAHLSDMGACVATHVSLQMVCVVVSVALVFTEEVQSRNKFLQQHAPLEARVSYGYRPLLALSLVMAVAEAYFGFYVILRSVDWIEKMWDRLKGSPVDVDVLELIAGWIFALYTFMV